MLIVHITAEVSYSFWQEGSSTGQKLPPIELSLLLKGSRFYGTVDGIERIHDLLDVGFVHLGEEVLDAVLVLQVVQHYEPLSGGRDKGRDEPLIELVNNLKVPDL